MLDRRVVVTTTTTTPSCTGTLHALSSSHALVILDDSDDTLLLPLEDIVVDSTTPTSSRLAKRLRLLKTSAPKPYYRLKTVKLSSTTLATTTTTPPPPPDLPPHLTKFHERRRELFDRFDEGIAIPDNDTWFSVTPQAIAAHIATRFKQQYGVTTVLDGCCGVGGNSIQFAQAGGAAAKVLAVDVSEARLEAARHNAGIYQVAERIEFRNQDVFQTLRESSSSFEGIFLSPPWGGPGYKSTGRLFDVDTDLRMKDEVTGLDLIRLALAFSPPPRVVAVYLPRNTDRTALLDKLERSFEVESFVLNDRPIAICIYFHLA